MDVQWTTEQQQVIQLQNRNILVSAAAGSGKTAVLVERIIQMLIREKDPVDVDQLLIVTFTEAAAAEMKERIREAIERQLAEHPENAHLQQQATLIHSARITTIHSFCLSVIREHFPVIDLDPGFRIADEGELKLLKQDVLGRLLEECYDESAPSFLELTEKFGTGRNDKKLEGLIFQIYENSRSYPQPHKWLDNCAKRYEIAEGEEPEVFQRAAERIRQLLHDMIRLLETSLEICEEEDGPLMYIEMLEDDLKQLEAAAEKREFAALFEKLHTIKWKALSRKKDPNVLPEKREQVKNLRDEVKKQIKNLDGIYFYQEPEQLLLDMQNEYPTVQAFTDLVKRFAECFSEEKKNRNLIDFNDMEHFALQILTQEDAQGELVPSLTAKEYQDQFYEVMIDEYQDSNLIQEAILTSVSKVSRGEHNVFMVGDVKQSIYRFRMSRPELFMEKYEHYTLEDSETQRIDLHKNFRSRADVLDSVNSIFFRIMQKDMGGVAYDKQAALYPGAEFEAQQDKKGRSVYETELLLLDTTQESADGARKKALGSTASREMEGRMIAHKIKELLVSGRVKDKSTGGSRKVQYRDIVILTRSIRGWADVFVDVLSQEGIPAYADNREGYFETYEVSLLLDYLSLLDNWRQDMPLTAVLTSPFVGLKAEDLAEIRLEYPKVPFYQAVENFIKEKQAEDPMLMKFWEQYGYFREKVPYTPIHELLWEILEKTGYGDYLTAMPGGAQRRANIHMLIEQASAFEGTSYKGLFHFVRYMAQLQKYEVDYGEASLLDEQADTVRIMSIHKSKGLEFPVVFVAGMGKQFNRRDLNGAMIVHPEWGIGIDAIDLERRTKTPTFLKKLIQQEVGLENLGEELRVLYVAMTRAKEKLILTGALARAYEELDRWDNWAKRAEGELALPFLTRSDARSYLDWILAATAGQSDMPIQTRVWGMEDFVQSTWEEEQTEEIARDVLEHWDAEREYVPEWRPELEEQINYVYPYEAEGTRKLKFTVSELKKRAYLEEEGGEMLFEEPEVIPLIPHFLEESEELTGASRGSAYHKVMELLDLSAEYTEETLHGAITAFQENGKLDPEMAACIQNADIVTFLQSNAGQRMRQAAKQGKLYREQPFVLGIPAEEVYPDAGEEETVLVQGIIDVFFEEEGELVVLDYKTDKVKTAEQLSEKYHAQLEYYAKALEQLLDKKVKQKLIYSFTLREEIEV